MPARGRLVSASAWERPWPRGQASDEPRKTARCHVAGHAASDQPFRVASDPRGGQVAGDGNELLPGSIEGAAVFAAAHRTWI
jgi:hypothetical protein